MVRRRYTKNMIPYLNFFIIFRFLILDNMLLYKYIVPRDFARDYGLDEPSHVVVEGTSEGILIRKLSI